MHCDKPSQRFANEFEHLCDHFCAPYLNTSFSITKIIELNAFAEELMQQFEQENVPAKKEVHFMDIQSPQSSISYLSPPKNSNEPQQHVVPVMDLLLHDLSSITLAPTSTNPSQEAQQQKLEDNFLMAGGYDDDESTHIHNMDEDAEMKDTDEQQEEANISFLGAQHQPHYSPYPQQQNYPIPSVTDPSPLHSRRSFKAKEASPPTVTLTPNRSIPLLHNMGSSDGFSQVEDVQEDEPITQATQQPKKRRQTQQQGRNKPMLTFR